MNSFPERLDVHRAVQFEQRLFQRRTDHRFTLSDKQTVFPSHGASPRARLKKTTIIKAGHSIAFGPTPIGKALQEQAITTLAPEPWFVTKISHSTDLAEFRGSFGKEGR